MTPTATKRRCLTEKHQWKREKVVRLLTDRQCRGRWDKRDGIREGELRVHWECRAWRASLQREKKRALLFPRGRGCCQEHQFLSATHSLEYKHISPLKNLFHFSKLEPPAWKDNGACPINSSSSFGLWQVLNCAISLDPHFKRSAFRWWK